MNGAEALIRTAVAAGIDVCFTNPGTTEMQLVGALDAVPEMRAVLGLFEGVCTGAADGYGRMTGKPALTLLHLGPGFANGIANLHNARRAHTPIVNLIGDHATWHLANDPPLASNVESLAWPVSAWVRTTKSARELPADAAEAIAAALTPPGGAATLVVPNDCAWDEVAGPARPVLPGAARRVPDSAVAAAAAALAGDAPSALLLGGAGLREAELLRAAAIAERTGCQLVCDTFIARLERGGSLPVVTRLPYFPEQVREFLSEISQLVLCGAGEPVSFFGYPDGVGRPTPDGCQVVELAAADTDIGAALDALAERLGAGVVPARVPGERPAAPTGALHPGTIGQALAALQPENAIIMDESATTGFAYGAVSTNCPPHTLLGLTGGAIGQGLPCATGASLACPERPVIAFQADGSGMYTLQALWTQAREGLDVTTLICANREYRILRVELGRAGIAEPGPTAESLTSLRDPALDWVSLARGMGVPGVSVDTAEALVKALEGAFAEPGPHLIEAVF
jgi:acetolactate synthase-1/2/3 large subunit